MTDRDPHSLASSRPARMTIYLRSGLIRTDRTVATIEQAALVFALISVVGVSMAVIVGREAGFYSLGRGADIIRGCIPWIAMLGASLGFREGRHVGLGELYPRASKRLRTVLDLGAGTAVLVFLVVLTWQGYVVVAAQRASGLTTSSLEFPMWWVTLSIPLGAFAATLHHVVRMAGPSAPLPSSPTDQEF